MNTFHPGGLELTMHAADAAGMAAGDKVLDIGCGTASSLSLLKDARGIVPCGVDASEKAITAARADRPDLELKSADACSLPFSEDSFDHVMMECVITLLDDPEAALHEAARVLRTGGHLIISALTSTDQNIDHRDLGKGFCRDGLITQGEGFCVNGLVVPNKLITYMEACGFDTVLSEDRKSDLTQYMVDSIMEYGSLEDRIRVETETVGGSVFDCNISYDRKTTSYHLFVFRKKGFIDNAPWNHGTPVDELVAERIGVDPSDLTQGKIEEYQLEAFRRTMRHAMEHSRFYRAHFSGLDPNCIRSMEDIRKIPSTSESDLAGNEWQFQCMPASDIDRTVTVPTLDQDKSEQENTGHDDSDHTVTLPTSGTSGNRKRIVFTAEDQERSIAFINRGFMTQRCTQGERMLVFMSGTTEGSIGDLVMRAMAPLEMDIKVYGAVTDIADAYEALMEFRPGVVEALPWHAAALARYGARYGNPEKEFIRSVNLSADVVPDSIVDRLEKLWGCIVHRHYGTTEMAIFGGVECEYHRGYHTRPCDILYEIPDTDADGYGEMLITTLDRKAMPLIRYRTGDIARFIDTPCPCGCRIRRIERFLGRRSSLIELAGGSFYLSELADAMYSIPEVIDFDVSVSSEEDNAEASSISTVSLTARTLPGDALDAGTISGTLTRISALDQAIKSGKTALMIDTEETLHFPSGYNLKKKVIRI